MLLTASIQVTPIGFDRLIDCNGPSWSRCLADTQPGDISLVFRTQRNQALVGVQRFTSAARRDPVEGIIADNDGIAIEPIPRSELLKSPALARLFRSRMNTCAMPPDAIAELLALRPALGPLLGVSVPDSHPVDDDASSLDELDPRWCTEQEMADALADDAAACDSLGIDGYLDREMRSPGSRRRADFAGRVELKRFGDHKALEQLLDYLALHDEFYDELAIGDLVIGNAYLETLEAAVSAHGNVRLWTYAHDENGDPQLHLVVDIDTETDD
jgi:hypothetical protein